MTGRQVPTWLLVLLSLLVGLSAGILAGREWDAYEYRLRRLSSARFLRAIRVQDSARVAELARRDSVRRVRASVARLIPPLELRRLQALNTCVLTYVMRGDRARNMALFHVDLRDHAGNRLPRAYAYREAGFPDGSSAQVIVPDVECGRLEIAGYGSAMVFDRPLELRGP